jgi:D-3-phosphoglycerate dehydrogenase
LKFVGRLGSGLDIIDLPYANEKDIQIVNSPEGNRNAVAEHAIGMLLALMNKMLQGDQEVRKFHWDREKNRGREITNLTIGIIGFGHTGSTFAKRLSGFDCKILAYDKYKVNYTENLPYVEKTSMEKIQKEADIISFHLPFTSETLHLADKEFLDLCKKGVIIINTSRGKVLKTKDLLIALNIGQVGGACLDVFENEKTLTYTIEEKNMYNSLYMMPNVVLTPHVAGWTVESKEKIAKTLLDKLLLPNSK